MEAVQLHEPLEYGEALSALRDALRRAVLPGAPADSGLAEHARALGLFELTGPDIVLKESARELYALVLVELARHHRLLARLVAAHHRAHLLFPAAVAASAPAAVARQVEELRVEAGTVSGSVAVDVPAATLRLLLVASPGQWLAVDVGEQPQAVTDRGALHGSGLFRVRLERAAASAVGEPSSHPLAAAQDVQDAMALIVGRLSAGHALALRFTQERQLFGRSLSDVPAVQAWAAAHAAALARLTAGLRALACGRPQASLAALWATFAREALETASGMSQLMGGTGLMEESLMPEVYREVVALIQNRPVRSSLETAGALADIILSSPGPGGISLEG